MRSKGKRAARVAVGALVTAIAVIGVAHAPFARPLFMRMGGCPMAAARMTPVESEAARHMALALVSGTVSAPQRPALGFDLDVTTRADVNAWARRGNAECIDARPGLVKCTRVMPSALGSSTEESAVDELALEFNGHDRLVNLTTYRSHLDPKRAAIAAQRLVSSLAEKLGPPERGAGDFGAGQFMFTGVESLSTVVYRFRDYVADVTAMNTPSGGPSIREHYMSARD